MSTGRMQHNKMQGRLPSKPGTHYDGGGLRLNIGPNGAGNWTLRYRFKGKNREVGLGAMANVSRKEARLAAATIRAQVQAGIDPKAEEKAPAAGDTFEQAALEYIRGRKKWTVKTAQVWTNSLTRYAFPVLGKMDVADIDHTHVKKVIAPIWDEKPETADKVLQRVQKVIEISDFAHDRERTNPAYKTRKLMPDREEDEEKKPKKRPALPWKEMPDFMARLRQIDKPVARALEFQILTGVRPGEVRSLTWDDIDGDVWTIPANKFKSRREHVVPLTPAAMALLPERGVGSVFPDLHMNSAQGVVYSMGYKGSEVTAHGMRSSLRTWCEHEGVRWTIAEMLIGHQVTDDKAKDAYIRPEDLTQAKREVLEKWAEFLAGEEEAAKGA